MKLKIEGQFTLEIVGIVKGLKNYGEIVEEEIKKGNFKQILISITDEEVEGLRDFLKHPYEIEMDDIEIIYEYHMRNFGETSIPPEAFIKAIEYADNNNLIIRGIDIPSGQYEDLFVENVSIFDIISLSLKKKRLIKRRWNLSDPESFSNDWDKYVNRRGYFKMEREREKYMAEAIVKNLNIDTIVIIDVERLNGVTAFLKTLLPEYKFQEN
ncbi:MAG: hypothetical protein ACP5TG_01260 [Thermoplasmata archaeon]